MNPVQIRFNSFPYPTHNSWIKTDHSSEGRVLFIGSFLIIYIMVSISAIIFDILSLEWIISNEPGIGLSNDNNRKINQFQLSSSNDKHVIVPISSNIQKNKKSFKIKSELSCEQNRSFVGMLGLRSFLRKWVNVCSDRSFNLQIFRAEFPKNQWKIQWVLRTKNVTRKARKLLNFNIYGLCVRMFKVQTFTHLRTNERVNTQHFY